MICVVERGSSRHFCVERYEPHCVLFTRKPVASIMTSFANNTSLKLCLLEEKKDLNFEGFDLSIIPNLHYQYFGAF